MSELVSYTPPSGSELEQTWQLASKLARTEFVPKTMRGSPEAVLACMLTGRELGLPPMQALRDVYLVNGRPALSATIMVARVRAFGHRFRTISNTTHEATVQIHRKGESEPEPPVTFTIEDAKRAKLVSKDVWQSYPERMLWARAASACCRRDCPEALGAALYTPEEVADFVSDPETDVSWGQVEVDRVTGEILEEPAAGVVTTTPTPAVAATTPKPGEPTGLHVNPQGWPTGFSVPTLDDLKRLRNRTQAKQLVKASAPDFAKLVEAAIHALYADMEPKRFWGEAELPAWKQVLEYAVELHDHQTYETSGAGGPEDGEASGEPAPDSPTHPGGDT